MKIDMQDTSVDQSQMEKTPMCLCLADEYTECDQIWKWTMVYIIQQPFDITSFFKLDCFCNLDSLVNF